MSRLKPWLTLFLVTALTYALFAQTAVVAVVNGTNVTFDDWNREANVTRLLIEIKNVNEVFYDVLVNTQEGQRLLEVYKRRALDTYIRKLLFIQFAQSLKVAPKPEDVRKEVDAEINKMLGDLKMTTEQLNKYLMDLGLGTLDDYRQRLYFQRTYSLSLSNVFALFALPTDQEIRTYYEKNKSKYTSPTTYDLLLFRVRDTATAERIRQEMLTGASGRDIAQRYNIQNFIDGRVVDGDTNAIPQAVWPFIRNATRGVPMNVSSGGERFVFMVRQVQLGGTKPLEEVRSEIVRELTVQKQESATEAIRKQFEEFIKNSKIEYRI